MFQLALLVLSLFRVATIGRLLESNNPPPEPRERPKSSEILEQYSGNAARMADKLADLYDDNYKLRNKNRDLTGEVATLKQRQTPEGAVVLSGDEAAAYEAYKALGKPDEVQARLGQVETLSAELGGLKRDAELRDVAAAYGYDFDALREFAGELPVAAYEADVDGAKTTRYRIGEGQGQADVAEWVKVQKPHVQRALAVTTTAGQGQQTPGVRVPVQGSGERPAPASPATDYLNRTYGPRKES